MNCVFKETNYFCAIIEQPLCMTRKTLEDIGVCDQFSILPSKDDLGCFYSGFKANFVLKVKVEAAQSCLTLCNPMDCPWNSPGQNGESR